MARRMTIFSVTYQAVAMLIDQGNEQQGILFPLGWLGLINIPS